MQGLGEAGVEREKNSSFEENCQARKCLSTGSHNKPELGGIQGQCLKILGVSFLTDFSGPGKQSNPHSSRFPSEGNFISRAPATPNKIHLQPGQACKMRLLFH